MGKIDIRNFTLILCFFLIFSSVNDLISQSQEQRYYAKGTLIFAIICEEGILLASDSRASFTFNETDEVYAYFDRNKKIFPLGDYQIGIGGITMLNKKYMHQITAKFNRKNKEKTSVMETYERFNKFLKEEYYYEDSMSRNQNQFLICGYQDSIPVILGVEKNGNVTKNHSVGHMFYNQTGFPEHINSLVSKDTEITCSNIAELIPEAFISLATSLNDYKIGGPIHIVKINKDNSIEELSKFKPYKFPSYKKMATKILKGKVDVIYIHDYSEKLLRETLLEGVEKGY